MKRVLLRLYQLLIASGRLILRILVGGEKAQQKYAWTAEGCLIRLVAYVFLGAIVLIIMASSTDVIKNIQYKVELMQALLIASAAIISVCGVFVGGARFRRVAAAFRILMLPVYFSLVIGLLTIISAINWLILADDRFLVATLVLFSLQICSFVFGILIRVPPRD